MIREDELLEELGLLKYYILQKKEGYRFSIDPILLAGFITVSQNDRILDLGTGGGILPFLLQKKNVEKKLNFTGVDIQGQYIDMAKRSAQINKLDNVDFIQADIKSLPKDFQKAFDLLICNPPFFAPHEGKVSQQEDLAIARHEIKVDFPSIAKAASFSMKERGRFFFIHRSQRLFSAYKDLEKEGLKISRLRFIHGRKDLPAKLFMAEAVKGGNPQLDLMPPLIIYDQEGVYSQEVKEYYE